MQRYEKYRESGVDWIGEIPEHWECKRLGTWFTERREKVSDKDYSPLSVTKNGIVPQLDNAAKSNDGDNRKLVKGGDFVINSRSDRKGSSGLSVLDGSVSLINIVMKPRNIDGKFSEYLLKSSAFVEEFYRNGHGIVADLWTTRFDEMKFINISVPPVEEQKKIVNFLDDKTAKIDQTIAIKEKEIELLKERRQILIQKAVTKGLDDTVTLKDSGVDWIGEIPEHWEVRKLKQVCKINVHSLDERTNPNYEFEYIDIGSVTYENGIISRESFLFKNAPSRARRIAKEGDTIVSTVRTYLKAIDFVDKCKSNYIFSTGFAVLEPNNNVYPRYLFSFIKSDAFTEQVSVNSKGMSYPAINSTELGVQKVLYLPYEEQIQIVSYLEVIEEKIAKAILLKQQEIEKLKEYKTVLIDNVVTGKVRVS